MSVKLYPRQAEAIAKVRKSFSEGAQRTVLVSPTGSGKTVMGSYMVHAAVEKNKRVLCLAHRTELIEQFSGKLDEFGVKNGIIKSGHWKKDYNRPVQVASVQTLINKLDQVGQFDFIMPDECHRSIAETYVRIINFFTEQKKNVFVLGLTATPIRRDNRGLNEQYEDMVVAAQTRELIEAGALVDYVLYAPPPIDIDKDSDTKLFGDIVSTWTDVAQDKQTIYFCPDIETSKKLEQQFLGSGYIAKEVNGGTHPDIRKHVVSQFKKGKIQILVNCDLFTEGTDIPNIECVGIARQTTSLALYLQIVGRGLRTHPGKKNCIILDHAGVSDQAMHDLPDIYQKWSLEGAKKQTRESGTEHSATICPLCHARFKPALTKGYCPTPGCDYKTEPKTPIFNHNIDVDLRLITPEERTRRIETRLFTLAQKAEEKKYNPKWAYHELARNLAREQGMTKQEAEVFIRTAYPQVQDSLRL